MVGHARHLQQKRADGDEEQERPHHQHRRAQVVIPQGAAHLGYLDQDDNQEVELYEYQVDILKILGVGNVEVKDIDRDKLYD